jgi:hypothetical protein
LREKEKEEDGSNEPGDKTHKKVLLDGTEELSACE